MLDAVWNRARIDRTRWEQEAFDEQFTCWLRTRQNSDQTRTHQSQLSAIGALLSGASRHLLVELGKIPESGASEDVNWQCGLFDRRVAWLHRIWAHYRARFDPRDMEPITSLLCAADEVVWSCFAPVNRVLDERRPPPLTYLGQDHTPLAFLVSQVPARLQTEAGRLREYLSRMPCPEVAVPVACIRSPWWLVLLGHETGHHVQEALSLQQPFRAWLRTLSNQEDQLVWEGWAEEVFADVYSVLVMGTSALTAIHEFDVTAVSDLTTRRERYPAPAVRLGLLAYTAKQLGFHRRAVDEALEGFDFARICQGCPRAERDLKVAQTIACESVGRLWSIRGRETTLRDLVEFDTELFEIEPVVGRRNTLGTARAVVSVALRRWARLHAIHESEERRGHIDMLRKTTLRDLKNSAVEGARSTVGTPSGVHGEELGMLLASLDLSP